MRKISFVIIFSFLFSCSSDIEHDCSEWERNHLVSNDFFDWEWECTPILNSYTNNGNWNAQVNIMDQSGSSNSYKLNNLYSITKDLNLINMVYPFNSLNESFEIGNYNNTYSLSYVFVDSKTFEFTINDTVFDPHVESIVIYNGEGQIIHNSGSTDAEIQFNCNYTFDGNNYTVSFLATR
tara:strand:+ start:194 stop:733 length:540 start_codon:yes stop_codon:yes gene_type:complete